MRAAAADDYRWSSTILAIVKSPPFQIQEIQIMIVTKKAISRRTVLRGIGATVALPLLDAMIPALTAPQRTPAKAVRRLASSITRTASCTRTGCRPASAPTSSSRACSRRSHRSAIASVIVTGLADRQAEALGDGGGDHSRASGSYLTGVHVKKSDTHRRELRSRWTRLRRGAFERETQLSSLQLTVDNNNLVGSCDMGYSCAYSNTLSWLTPTLPLMSENDPRVVFERLFGSSDSTDPRVRALRLRQDRSILDSVTARVRQLQRQLGAADNTKVSDYLESLRDVERRILKAEEQSARELPEVDRPVGIPDAFDEHVALLYDLQVLAFQCDLTRVITFMYGREQSARTYPQLGISDPHHQLTHHQNDPEKLEKCTKIQTHHTALFTAFLEKLRSTPDGDGSLLDNSVILYGGGAQQQRPPYPQPVADGGGRRRCRAPSRAGVTSCIPRARR